ncbi:MAG: hypothetical protein EOP04_13570 [Proteobacteria bacterium]|nr:MAG: hypothetical protein EOP04_13570 [Pseudomonadota bacterium]
MQNSHHTPRRQVAKPLRSALTFTGLLLLAAVNQGSAHASTPLSDQQLQTQQGATVYTNTTCEATGHCTDTQCTFTGQLTCSRTQDTGYSICSGTVAPRGTPPCAYPNHYYPCARTLSGSNAGVQWDPKLHCTCDTVGPTVEWHNTCA